MRIIERPEVKGGFVPCVECGVGTRSHVLENAEYEEYEEVWEDEKLVGGLYGIDLPKKKVFCGESMFSLVSDASKVAFFHLSEYVKAKNYKFIDCQIYNAHLESLGAEEIGRGEFLRRLVL